MMAVTPVQSSPLPALQNGDGPSTADEWEICLSPVALLSQNAWYTIMLPLSTLVASFGHRGYA